MWNKGKCPEWSKKNAEVLAQFQAAASHLESVGRLELLPRLRRAGYDDGTLLGCTAEKLVRDVRLLEIAGQV